MPLGVLSREAVLRAVEEFDRLGRDAFLQKYGFGRATDYWLLANGRQYDPKAIAGVAYGYDHPDEGALTADRFSGGEALRRSYEPAGFPLVRQDAHALQQLLEDFMRGYPEAKQGAFSGSHPVQETLRALRVRLQDSDPVSARGTVLVAVSAGKGNWAGVPWIAFLDRRLTESTKSGVYPVFLFREDMTGVYLTVAQGVTELKETGDRAHLRAALRATAERLRPHGAALRERGFALDNDLRLSDRPGLGRDYELSTVAHKLYPAGAVPDDTEILSDLEAALSMVETDLEGPTVEQTTGSSSFAEAARAFRAAVDASGLLVPTGHGDRVQSLLAALTTKPFVILSGLSGSGKTQLALRLGEWFGTGPTGRRALTVPVRPDWTGPEALFGYQDALRSVREGRAAWFVPAPLEFLLRASREPDMPYLLLLDEMNLAHVERYFSDFLSGIESRDAVLPNLQLEGDGEWRVPAGETDLTPLPRNVFVVGTVNVDETTYQFSPKVLDRATTFEVRTQSDELRPDVLRPTAALPAQDGDLRTLVLRATQDQWSEEHQLLVATVAAALKRLHVALALTDDEFGHRLFYESLRLVRALAALGVTERDAVLDSIVLLKILPRIHGSRRRADPVLRRLAAFAGDVDGDLEHVEEAVVRALPMTAAKVARMRRALEVNQYVSFMD